MHNKKSELILMYISLNMYHTETKAKPRDLAEICFMLFMNCFEDEQFLRKSRKSNMSFT
jgi:hypothetical protein